MPIMLIVPRNGLPPHSPPITREFQSGSILFAVPSQVHATAARQQQKAQKCLPVTTLEGQTCSFLLYRTSVR